MDSMSDSHGEAPRRRPAARHSASCGRSTESVSTPPEALSPWISLRSASAHPFVFQKMVRAVDPVAQPGDVVHVYDRGGAFFGRGLFNPRSQIVIRMLSFADVAIDDDFWRARLQAAVDLRSALRLSSSTDAYRLLHAEGDQLSGLMVERYADVLVFELFSLGMYQRVARLAELLAAVLGPPLPEEVGRGWRVVVRADDAIERIEGFRVSPRERSGFDTAASPSASARPLNQLVVREHGLRYRVDVVGGQKTGFFCDQRDNRRRFAQLCGGARVLDLCCYTGGFGLCARVLGGAAEVSSVDLDEQALAVARENANLNQVRIDYVHADAFLYMRQMLANRRAYDAIVLDPPKLATSRAEYEDALRKYNDLNTLALQLVRPGGFFLTCSCSGLVGFDAFVQTVHAAARRAGRRLQLFDASGAAPDHPVMLNCPESAYLKALWFRVLERS